MRSAAVMLLLIAGCGDALPESEYPPQPPEPGSPRASKQPLPEGSLHRKDVVAIVDQGLGHFLQRIQVEPKLKQGKFAGFRVLALQPPTFWEGVDLKPGDVITHVNGQSIERPKDAYEVFEGLRRAKELRVGLEREGKRRELVFPIVGRAKAASKRRSG